MYALNINKEDNRILSACKMLPKGNYDDMPQVTELPLKEDGTPDNIADYLYVDGEYVYEPLPEPEPVEPEPTPEYATYDDLASAIREGVNSYGE